MSPRFFALFISLFIFSPAVASEPSPTPEPPSLAARPSSCTVHRDAGEVRCALSKRTEVTITLGDLDAGEVTSIIAQTHGRPQALSYDSATVMIHEETALHVLVEDMNFDGHLDLAVAQFVPAGPNTPYTYWLFDPKEEKLVRNKGLEPISAPAFDSSRRTITSAWRGSAANHGVDVYGWEGAGIERLYHAECELNPQTGFARLSGLHQTPQRIDSYDACLKQIHQGALAISGE